MSVYVFFFVVAPATFFKKHIALMNPLQDQHLCVQILSFDEPLWYIEIYDEKKLGSRIQRLKSLLFFNRDLFPRILTLLRLYKRVEYVLRTYQHFGYGLPCLYDALTCGCKLPYASYR